MKRPSRATIEQICALYVEGEATDDGKLIYPTNVDIAARFGTTSRSISRWIVSHGLAEKRNAYRLSFRLGHQRQKLLALLAASEKSLGTDLSAAHILQQSALKVFASVAESETLDGKKVVLKPAELRLLAEVFKAAQQIRKLALGESTQIITKRGETQAESDAATAAAVGGVLSMPVAEQIKALEALRKLPGAELLRAYGIGPVPPPKKAAG
jgi:peptidyl-tRNA hydrolase